MPMTSTTSLTLKTAPAVEPMTTAEAKTHMRVDIADEDDYIDTLIESGRRFAEVETGRSFITTTWELRIDGGFPAMIRLPKPPLQSVTSVKYVDEDGVTQTLAADQYDVGIYLEWGRIVPAFDVTWPSTRNQLNAVTVEYKAGYGDAAASVPAPIKHAVKFLTAHMFEQREPILTGTIQSELPYSVRNLLNAFKVPEFH